MKTRTISGERTVHFPQSPAPGYQHTEHGRTWQWVEDPGMWRSVSGGVAGNTKVTWEEVEGKPAPIEALGKQNIIIGGSY